MDLQAIRKELTGKKLLIAAALGIIMGLTLQAVIVVFGRSKFMPVLFVLLVIIFVLAEILWLSRERITL